MITAPSNRLALCAIAACVCLFGCGGTNNAQDDIESADSKRSEGALIADRKVPRITIQSSSGPDDQGQLSLTGVASDNRRVATVKWISSSGATGVATIDRGSGSRMVGWKASVPSVVGENVVKAVAVDGAGNTASAVATITVDGTASASPPPAPPPPPGSPPDPAPAQPPAPSEPAAPSVTLSASPTTVSLGGTTILTWNATNATGCAASGGWTGSLDTSGSMQSATLWASSTVFNLQCSGAGGNANAAVTVTAAGSGGDNITGLDFPSNGQTSQDVRFRFMGSSLPPMYPATYIWRIKVRPQSGYYTTFFWGQADGAFVADSYYGAHPYPDNGLETGRTHKWEISISGVDITNDANGHSTQLGYDQWRTQALRVFDDGSAKRHEFYWDLSDTSKVIRTSVDRGYGVSPPFTPALTFGDAPWNIGVERLSGILRGIQIYSAALSINDIMSEVNAPLSSAAGNGNIWYLNINPTPSDISDKSGRGHHPNWVGSGRAALWTGP